MSDINKILETAKEAAHKAGQIAKETRESGDIGINFKGALDLVTQADIKAEKAILEIIRAKFPEHTILAEESASDFGGKDFSGPVWIIDPIDGTTNFAHSHPQVGVSIAFSDRGNVQAGVVHSPFQDETFHAVKGGGAFLNNKPIHVSACSKLSSALVATGFPYDRADLDFLLRRLKLVLKNCRDIRRIGGAALDISWVACGRMDAYYEDVLPWDMAAATLIAKEAGATVGYSCKQDKHAALPADLHPKGMVVANPLLFQKLMDLLISVEK